MTQPGAERKGLKTLTLLIKNLVIRTFYIVALSLLSLFWARLEPLIEPDPAHRLWLIAFFSHDVKTSNKYYNSFISSSSQFYYKFY